MKKDELKKHSTKQNNRHGKQRKNMRRCLRTRNQHSNQPRHPKMTPVVKNKGLGKRKLKKAQAVRFQKEGISNQDA